MEKNITQNLSEILENQPFNDTGSNIFKENQDISVKTNEISAKEEKREEKPLKTADFPLNSNEKSEKSTDLSSFFSKDSENSLKTAYPAVDIEKLKNNKDFCSLLSIIMANPSLSQVYSCFNSIVSSAEEKSREKTIQALANAKSSVGSLASNKQNSDTFFTKDQVLQMSPSQIRQNYEKIRQSQQKW